MNSPISKKTPLNTPRDIEGLVALGRYDMRVLAKQLNMFPDDNAETAFAGLHVNDQAGHLLACLKAWDQANPGQHMAQGHAPPAAPPQAASAPAPQFAPPGGYAPPQAAPQPQFQPPQGYPQQGGYAPPPGPQGGFPPPAQPGFAPPQFAPPPAPSGFAPPGFAPPGGAGPMPPPQMPPNGMAANGAVGAPPGMAPPPPPGNFPQHAPPPGYAPPPMQQTQMFPGAPPAAAPPAAGETEGKKMTRKRNPKNSDATAAAPAPAPAPVAAAPAAAGGHDPALLEQVRALTAQVQAMNQQQLLMTSMLVTIVGANFDGDDATIVKVAMDNMPNIARLLGKA